MLSLWNDVVVPYHHCSSLSFRRESDKRRMKGKTPWIVPNTEVLIPTLDRDTTSRGRSRETYQESHRRSCTLSPRTKTMAFDISNK
jgi:hypothetical protein